MCYSCVDTWVARFSAFEPERNDTDQVKPLRFRKHQRSTRITLQSMNEYWFAILSLIILDAILFNWIGTFVHVITWHASIPPRFVPAQMTESSTTTVRNFWYASEQLCFVTTGTCTSLNVPLEGPSSFLIQFIIENELDRFIENQKIWIILKDVAPHPATKGFDLSKFRLLSDVSVGKQIGCTSAIHLNRF